MAQVGYARVSTIDQSPALQFDALAAAGCVKVFEDRASGVRADRAGLRSALEYVREGDVLVVWKLDRLGRSLPHLIETVTTLEKSGVGFRSVTEAIDTTTPGGRLVFHLFGALGQFERDLIRERTRAALKAAEARGHKGGRKPVVTIDKLKRARDLIAEGLTIREAAVRVKMGKTALYEALRSHAEPELTQTPSGPTNRALVGDQCWHDDLWCHALLGDRRRETGTGRCSVMSQPPSGYPQCGEDGWRA